MIDKEQRRRIRVIYEFDVTCSGTLDIHAEQIFGSSDGEFVDAHITNFHCELLPKSTEEEAHHKTSQ